MQTLIPTQLFIGPQDILTQKAFSLLQSNFCKNKDVQDCFCNQCRKIKNNQHESIVWINPETDYTLKDIQIIFEKTNFALEPNQKFFFILQKAHTLSTACANKLLKILEEPPAGYNFILLTNNANSILPTIFSRCHVTNFSSKATDLITANSVTNFFYNQKLNEPAEFEKELKNQQLSDSQSIELVNEMLLFFEQKLVEYYKIEQKQNEQIEYYKEVVDFLKDKMRKPPQSGSSALFWKNIYLAFPKEPLDKNLRYDFASHFESLHTSTGSV